MGVCTCRFSLHVIRFAFDCKSKLEDHLPSLDDIAE